MEGKKGRGCLYRKVRVLPIITDMDPRVKMAIVDWHVALSVSINDPEVVANIPVSLTAATRMDSLTHAVEAYVFAIPVTGSASLKAIDLISQYRRLAMLMEKTWKQGIRWLT